jgi:DNA-binding SARP family transcriptional activator
MAERLVLRLLGPFAAEVDEQPVIRFEAATARALVAYLATHRRQPQLRAHLAAVLWGIDVERTGLTNLRSSLRRVRNALDAADAAEPEGDNGISCLLTDRETVQFRPDLAVEVDVELFDNLLRAVDGHSHTSVYECPDCVARYRRAVDLYRGPFLADLNVETELFEQWRTTLQDRYRRQVLQALHVLAEHEFRLGSFTAAEALARRQLEIEHWNEESHRQLMRVLLASGRRSAALAQYEICRQVLDAELGAVPAEETDTLYERIVAGVAPPAPVQQYNPYKGLEAFAVGDALYFYGRETMTNRLLAAVCEQPVVALIGASGSGKSSVIHAGLAASLAATPHHRRRHVSNAQDGGAGVIGAFSWCVGSLRPGAAPLTALADTLLACGYTPPEHSSLVELLRHEEVTLAAVADSLAAARHNGSSPPPAPLRLLLIVDQFEEVFTHCRDAHARNAFLHFLLGPGGAAARAVPTVSVVSAAASAGAAGDHERASAVALLAMRADFLGSKAQRSNRAWWTACWTTSARNQGVFHSSSLRWRCSGFANRTAG